MTTALLTHPDCLAHVTPDGHPERVARLQTVLKTLEDPAFDALDRRAAPRASAAAIARAHPDPYWAAITANAPTEGWAQIDGDTFLSPGSVAAAERAAGAVIAAVDLVIGGEASNAFCAVRPPGHHAESDRAMGFCLLSSAAIGALHALAEHGLDRVAIVDFDVHHGNGSQEIFERDGRVLYASTHEWPLFPGTGRDSETGVGNIVNACLPSGSGGAAFKAAFETRVLPALDAFDPQLVIISAGFDAHARDPLAGLALSEDDLAWATSALCDLAAARCQGRVVSTLEGGYDLQALGLCVDAHVRTLMRHGQSSGA